MDSFNEAVNFITQSKVTTNSQTKLRLYGLYKIATTSPIPLTSRPGIFDFTGRSKYDSWKELGSSDIYVGEAGKIIAQDQYIAEARSLGFFDSSDRLEKEEGSIIREVVEIRIEKEERMVGVSVMETEESPIDNNPSKLHDLAVRNEVEKLKELLKLEGGRVNEIDSYGYTPLHLAADRGHTEIVKLLLAAGAEKEILDSEGITAWELSEEAGHDDIAVILGRS